jgi:ribosomal protein S6--L-glutamate ligase
MILSFHPIIEADKNIICAGREPNEVDLAAILQAQAVILPQGCSESLYRMTRDNCDHYFPNMDVRYDYPGKCRQIDLFRKFDIAHPPTTVFRSTADLGPLDGIRLPAVIKLDWGGQGDTVFKAQNIDTLHSIIHHIKKFEKSGQTGFVVQKWITSANKSLRVVVIGNQTFSYWRIQPKETQFGDSLSRGARIDHDAEAHLQSAAKQVARRFCKKSGLQLAGFDFLFDIKSLKNNHIEPLMLEINYFFGRTGLGGSQRYYELLIEATDQWLTSIGLQRS